MEPPKVHINRFASNINAQSARIYGSRLEPGDVIRPTDKYNSNDGAWRNNTSHGKPLEKNAGAIFVRPV